jgi:hypothetical protein
VNRTVRGVLLALAISQAQPPLALAAEAAGRDLGFEVVTEDNNPAEFLLLSPKLKGMRLGTSITAYQHEGLYYIPLFASARLLELGIRPGAKPGTALGFIIDEGRAFSLDAGTRQVTYGKHTGTFAADQVQVREDDIYVDSRLLSVWFPLAFDINTFASVVEFKPSEPMPVQLRLERERRLKALRLGKSIDGLYPRYASPYRMWDGPFLDQTVIGRARREPAVDELGAAYSTYLAADLAYLETSAYFFGDELDPLRDYRINAGRRDYFGRLLGPLGARELVGGHLYADSLPLVYHSRIVLGGMVSNFPLGRANEPRGHTFRGPLPPGWTVELYRQDVLLDFRRADSTGLYLFEDVSLNTGMNTFTLVFYGPYGERREETYSFNLADSIPEPGTFHYRIVGGQDEMDGPLATVVGEYGVHQNVSLTSSFATVPLLNGQGQYYSLGTRAFAGPVYGRANVSMTETGSLGADMGVQTQVGRVNLDGSYVRLGDNFDSVVYPLSPYQLSDRTGLGADYSLWITNQVPANIAFDVSRDRYRNGNNLFRTQNRLGTSLASFSITNRLAWYHGITRVNENSLADGSFAISRNVDPRGRVRALGELGYFVHPRFEPRGFAAQLLAELPYKTFGVVGFSREFGDESRTEVGLSKDFDVLAAGLTWRYTYPRYQEVFLQMNFGFGYVRPRRDVHFTSAGIGGSGTAVIRIFLDLNQNGRWDAGEPPLPNTGIMVNGVSAPERSGSDGMLFISRLPAHQPTDIALALSTLEDSGWMSTVTGLNVIPRPGRTITVDLPVVPTGEIDGTVWVIRNGIRQEMPGLRVELVDRRGGVRKQISAYDGFFLFQRVPAGAYVLRLSPEQLRELGLSESKGREVLITNEGSILNGLDLEVPAN